MTDREKVLKAAIDDAVALTRACKGAGQDEGVVLAVLLGNQLTTLVHTLKDIHRSLAHSRYHVPGADE